MSRFASGESTARLDLGPCQCDGAPHDGDYVIYRTRYGYAALLEIASQLDIASQRLKALELGIVGWNFLGSDGEVAPVDATTVGALDFPTAQAIFERIDESVGKSNELPNASGARSRASSRASASPRRRQSPTLTTP